MRRGIFSLLIERIRNKLVGNMPYINEEVVRQKLKEIVELTKAPESFAEKWYKLLNYDFDKTIDFITEHSVPIAFTGDNNKKESGKVPDKDRYNEINNKLKENEENNKDFSKEIENKVNDLYISDTGAPMLHKDSIASDNQIPMENEDKWNDLLTEFIFVFCANESDYRFAVNFVENNSTLNPNGKYKVLKNNFGGMKPKAAVFFSDGNGLIKWSDYEKMTSYLFNLSEQCTVFFIDENLSIKKLSNEKKIDKESMRIKLQI